MDLEILGTRCVISLLVLFAGFFQERFWRVLVVSEFDHFYEFH